MLLASLNISEINKYGDNVGSSMKRMNMYIQEMNMLQNCTQLQISYSLNVDHDTCPEVFKTEQHI
jgi:hypothetical protein